jgi:hypothetical protein
MVCQYHDAICTMQGQSWIILEYSMSVVPLRFLVPGGGPLPQTRKKPWFLDKRTLGTADIALNMG